MLRAGAGDRFSRAAGNRVDALKHGPLDPATPAQPLGARWFPLPSVVTPDLLSRSTTCVLPAPPPPPTPAKCRGARWPCPVVAPRRVLVAVAATRAASHSGCCCPGKAPAATRGRQPGNGARTKPAAQRRPGSARSMGAFSPSSPSRPAVPRSQVRAPSLFTFFQNKSFWGRISCRRTMAAGPGRRL